MGISARSRWMSKRKIIEIDRDKCDGCGLCTTACAEGALALDAENKAVIVREIFCDGLGACLDVCPTDALKVVERESEAYDSRAAFVKPRLSQWPIQLHLVSPLAPYFEGSDLLVAADCTAFALGGFHDDLLKGKKLVIACPKLDETQGYMEKLAEFIKGNSLKSLTVAIMTVPCCSGLERLVRQAVSLSGEPLDLRKVVVGIDGRVVQAAPTRE